MLGLAGKKVLMPAYHHGVELETLLAAQVTPVFFRVDAQMRADFEDARARSAGVAAVYVIHYAGFPQDMRAARQLARELGVPLIEDCALALLSREGEKPLGSSGDLFYAKASVEDILIRITAINRGPEAAMLDLLPTIWFRNTWSWGIDERRPRLRREDALPDAKASQTESVIRIRHFDMPLRWLICEGTPETIVANGDVQRAYLGA